MRTQAAKTLNMINNAVGDYVTILAVCKTIYYIDTDVLLKNIPLVKFIKNTSGSRVVYFP